MPEINLPVGYVEIQFNTTIIGECPDISGKSLVDITRIMTRLQLYKMWLIVKTSI